MIEVVLFDMGGVLVELGSLPELLGTNRSEADFWPQWLSSSAVQQFERGQSSPAEFAAQAVVDLDLTIDAESFLANFAQFPRGLYPGARQLVSDVAKVATTAVLSNTNGLHWQAQPEAETIRALFAHSYLSYEIGSVKPDEAIYRHVLDDLNVPAQQILFIDDNEINVVGARRCGLTAEVAKGPTQARRVLEAHDLWRRAEPAHRQC